MATASPPPSPRPVPYRFAALGWVVRLLKPVDVNTMKELIRLFDLMNVPQSPPDLPGVVLMKPSDDPRLDLSGTFFLTGYSKGVMGASEGRPTHLAISRDGRIVGADVNWNYASIARVLRRYKLSNSRPLGWEKDHPQPWPV